MMQAIAMNMGVPVDDLQCGFANQLCLTSPTASPTQTPVAITAQRSRSADSHLNYDSLDLLDVSRDGSAPAIVTKPLVFSVYRDIPGIVNNHLNASVTCLNMCHVTIRME